MNVRAHKKCTTRRWDVGSEGKKYFQLNMCITMMCGDRGKWREQIWMNGKASPIVVTWFSWAKWQLRAHAMEIFGRDIRPKGNSIIQYLRKVQIVKIVESPMAHSIDWFALLFNQRARIARPTTNITQTLKVMNGCSLQCAVYEIYETVIWLLFLFFLFFA